MSNNYQIDLATDVIRGRNNFGERRLIENLSLLEVKNYIDNFSSKFGKPANIVGMLVWSDNLDSYCLSIYKDNKPFELDVASIENEV